MSDAPTEIISSGKGPPQPKSAYRQPWFVGLAVLLVLLVIGAGVGIKTMNDDQNAKLAAVQLQQKRDKAAADAAARKVRQAASAAKAKAAAVAAAAKAKKQASDLAKIKADAAQAKKDAAEAQRRAAQKPTTVYVQPAPAPAPVYVPYSDPSYGTFSLTSSAYPGPIHSYVEPSDTSAFVAEIPATSSVSVVCSVHGQNLQGHDLWDWDGSGYIWDHMVDMGGASPPLCQGD
jgi:hypothetical protein